MKSIIAISLLVGLAACAKPLPAKAPVAKATAADCIQVYNNLITIAIRDNFGPPERLTPENRVLARAIVESYLRETGQSKSFFTVCTTSASKELTDCMAQATSMVGIHVCGQTYETKRNP
jgi:hypothetical protein